MNFDKVCEVCDGGPGNDGPCLCGLNAPPIAPVGVPVGVVWEYLDARSCYEAATRRPNSHAPAPRLKHGDPVVLRLRDARVALDNAIARAQQSAAEAQAQGGGWCVERGGDPDFPQWAEVKELIVSSPPSTPVGTAGHVHPHVKSSDCHCIQCRPLEKPCDCGGCRDLTQQPAAVDGAQAEATRARRHRIGLEHIAASCEGRAAEIARAALAQQPATVDGVCAHDFTKCCDMSLPQTFELVCRKCGASA